MDLLKHAHKIVKFSYGVESYEDFSGSIAALNNLTMERIGPVPWHEYRWYIKSPLWKTRREIYLEHYEGVCQRCHKKGFGLSLHHQSYVRLGVENLDGDLILLCRRCHRIVENDKIHEMQFNGCHTSGSVKI